jgi:hypothetical protein
VLALMIFIPTEHGGASCWLLSLVLYTASILTNLEVIKAIDTGR